MLLCVGEPLLRLGEPLLRLGELLLSRLRPLLGSLGALQLLLGAAERCVRLSLGLPLEAFEALLLRFELPAEHLHLRAQRARLLLRLLVHTRRRRLLR